MSESYEQRSEGGSRSGEHSTEKDRKTGTTRIQSDEIEQKLGTGSGNKSPGKGSGGPV